MGANDTADGTDRETIPRSAFIVDVSDWDMETEAEIAGDAPQLPLSMHSSRPHVVFDIDKPAHAYVIRDTWIHDGKRQVWRWAHEIDHRSCMNVGTVLASQRGPYHCPVPCYSPTCERCGPERCRSIHAQFARHTADIDRVWLYSIHGADEDEIARKRLAVTRIVRKRRGDFLWVTVRCGKSLLCLVFCSVDHSVGPYDGNPARTCEALTRSEASAYLEYLLWHGFEARGASRRWPLCDGERFAKGTGTAANIGRLSIRNYVNMLLAARELYELDREAAALDGIIFDVWGPYDDVPPLPAAAQVKDLFERARDVAMLTAQARAA